MRGSLFCELRCMQKASLNEVQQKNTILNIRLIKPSGPASCFFVVALNSPNALVPLFEDDCGEGFVYERRELVC